MSRVPARALKHLPFPECGSTCAAVEYLGVGECESVCPFKFDSNGDPINGKSKQEQATKEEKQAQAREATKAESGASEENEGAAGSQAETSDGSEEKVPEA